MCIISTICDLVSYIVYYTNTILRSSFHIPNEKYPMKTEPLANLYSPIPCISLSLNGPTHILIYVYIYKLNI